MKTNQEILNDIHQEFQTRKENGENYYQIKDFYGLFYVNKYMPDKEKSSFAKEAILDTLSFFKEKRKELFDRRDEFDINTIHTITPSVYSHHTLLQFCVPYAVKNMVESDIRPFVEFFYEAHSFEVFNHRRNETSTIDLNRMLLYDDLVLDMVIHFQIDNSISSILIEPLKEYRVGLVKKGYDSQIKRVDAILENTAVPALIKEEETPVRDLWRVDFEKSKKWQWLRDYDIKFIDNRTEFYELVAALSKLNYFNNFRITKEMNQIIESINPKEYEVFILDLFDGIQKEGNKRSGWFVGDKVIGFQIFVWLMNRLNTPNQYSILSKLAEKCFTKIPRVGPTSRKLGDVVLKILDESETIEGLGVLLNLKTRSKYPVFREALNNSIKRAINFTKLNPNEVEDYFINDYGIKNGQIAFDFGDFQSIIDVEQFDKVNLLWYKPDGSTQKSIPAKVKNEFASELKIWKAKAKDIKKEISVQKQRLESVWRLKKSWQFSNWKKYVLNHEIVRFISRKLIWRFEKNGEFHSAFWFNGKLAGPDFEEINGLENSTVTLWHPSFASVEKVQAWRGFMLENEIKQPFKQAFREIYLVTDAEITTSTFSNRFLNHIVRHHKFSALAKQRTWIYPNIYAGAYPHIEYQDYKVKATFDLTNNHDLATTGRIHFRDIKKNEAIRMEEVPTIIFSETMRDADLFVGVCSIGIEEEWNQNQHRNYWERYSTSDLSETAKTRRSILANMIPKLNIKDQCVLYERYLKVTGKIRTYKIHLGSGNILMEPNDQYLCIVPDRTRKTKADKLFIPFDDDAVFSIILSKVFLLANDDKITDRVILNQIRH